MSPVGIIHGKIIKELNRLITSRFPEDVYTIGVQDPVTLSENSEPEPDISIAKGPPEAYDRHPTADDLYLVVEVFDTTLSQDRRSKKLIYATAGVPEY